MNPDEPFLVLSGDQSPEGLRRYAETLEDLRRSSGIYAVATTSPLAGVYISLAVVILVCIFLYMLYGGKDANEEIVVYGSIISIGLLIASGISI